MVKSEGGIKLNPSDQDCKNCKHRKLSMLTPPCKDCHWEGEETGYTHWEPAEVDNGFNR